MLVRPTNFKYLANSCFKLYFRTFKLKVFQVPNTSENSPFRKIWSNELNHLINLFDESHYKIRIAGGAVRDILMNMEPHDIDFATDATPSEMKEIFVNHNIRMINTNGESHGTITPRINDKENFEITTLRIDKITDGRRAEVEFTKDWKIDAERRDLTINAMFLDKEGNVYDYFNGYDDIRNRIVRFVGDPAKRIQEDYLRILRYFRFYGRIAEHPDNHIAETIEKIRENRTGLKNVSGERIWMEMSKIISGNHAPEIMIKMNECGLLPLMGLPDNACLSRFQSLYPVLIKNNCNPSVFLSTILNDEDQVMQVTQRFRLSSIEFMLAHFIVTRRDKLSSIINGNSDDDILRYFQDDFVMHHGEPSLFKLKMCFNEYLKYCDRLDIWSRFDAWKPPKFPVKGILVSEHWNIKGKQLNRALYFLKQKWFESHYKASVTDLVENQTYRSEFMINESLTSITKK